MISQGYMIPAFVGQIMAWRLYSYRIADSKNVVIYKLKNKLLYEVNKLFY